MPASWRVLVMAGGWSAKRSDALMSHSFSLTSYAAATAQGQRCPPLHLLAYGTVECRLRMQHERYSCQPSNNLPQQRIGSPPTNATWRQSQPHSPSANFRCAACRCGTAQAPPQDAATAPAALAPAAAPAGREAMAPAATARRWLAAAAAAAPPRLRAGLADSPRRVRRSLKLPRNGAAAPSSSPQGKRWDAAAWDAATWAAVPLLQALVQLRRHPPSQQPRQRNRAHQQASVAPSLLPPVPALSLGTVAADVAAVAAATRSRHHTASRMATRAVAVDSSAGLQSAGRAAAAGAAAVAAVAAAKDLQLALAPPPPRRHCRRRHQHGLRLLRPAGPQMLQPRPLRPPAASRRAVPDGGSASPPEA